MARGANDASEGGVTRRASGIKASSAGAASWRRQQNKAWRSAAMTAWRVTLNNGAYGGVAAHRGDASNRQQQQMACVKRWFNGIKHQHRNAARRDGAGVVTWPRVTALSVAA